MSEPNQILPRLFIDRDEVIEERIIQACMIVCGVPSFDYVIHNRETDRIECKHYAFTFLRKYVDIPLREVAAKFKLKDHSTVIHGIQKTNERNLYPKYKRIYQKIDELAQAIIKDSFQYQRRLGLLQNKPTDFTVKNITPSYQIV